MENSKPISAGQIVIQVQPRQVKPRICRISVKLPAPRRGRFTNQETMHVEKAHRGEHYETA